MHPDAPLPAHRLAQGASLTQASPWQTHPVTLDSPALDVMTDLSKVKAATVQPDQSLRQAEQAMIYQGVRLLFVVSEMPALEGLITTNDLSAERPIGRLQERHVRYDELRVADVMTERSQLDAIELDAVQRGTVRNVVATFKHVGRNHLMVVQQGRVCGVISRSQVERQLGQTIDIVPIASNFSEVERALV